jgi:hypothetical protein
MPPEPVTSPHRRFVVTRIDNGVDTNVIATTPLPVNYTTDQVVRRQTGDNIQTYLAANPGVVLRVYGPTNATNQAHTDADCIYDSRVSGPWPWLTS